MRVLQLGVGAVGEVTARTIASIPEVTNVTLADIDDERPRAVAALLPRGKASCLQLDASDKDALVEALADADLVINGLAPDFNMDVLAASLEAGTNYLDMAAGGPREIVGTADVDEELALDAEFRRKGLTAMVFFGIDPGASDVFARALYEQFDTVERLTVLDGDNGRVEGYDLACGFSPTTMIEECLLPPTGFTDGRTVHHEPLTRSREFGFPEPVGRLKLWNVDHEESQLMPLYLGDKGLRQADFFIALDDGFVTMLKVARTLGLDSKEIVEFKGGRFSPREFLVSRLPRPIDLYGKLTGQVCVGTLCEGTIGGRAVRRFMYQITDHQESFRTFGVQGTGFQTGTPAACAAILFAQGVIGEKGVLAPERIPHEPFLAEMTRRGTPWSVVDLPADDR
jgi:saccharopine dehydrogenase (NAD+, L-lysine forming)